MIGVYAFNGRTPFCTKTNPCENRFFAARWAIGGKIAAIMLIFLLKIRQNVCGMYASIGNGTKGMYAYHSLGEPLQGLH